MTQYSPYNQVFFRDKKRQSGSWCIKCSIALRLDSRQVGLFHGSIFNLPAREMKARDIYRKSKVAWEALSLAVVVMIDLYTPA